MEHPIRVLAEGRHLRLVDEGGWEYTQRLNICGIVVIVAVTPEGRILLVEQYRQPMHSRVVELPAGLAGDTPEAANEPLTAAARRELFEETGYEAGSFDLLAEGPPSPGMTSERISFFRANDLSKTGPGGGDEAEDIEVHEVSLEAAPEWLWERERAGRLVDPKVYAGLYFASCPSSPARASTRSSSR
jgi:ADP-ribose pyrophosphatase